MKYRLRERGQTSKTERHAGLTENRTEGGVEKRRPMFGLSRDYVGLA